jgi:hypothetical protein
MVLGLHAECGFVAVLFTKLAHKLSVKDINMVAESLLRTEAGPRVITVLKCAIKDAKVSESKLRFVLLTGSCL